MTAATATAWQTRSVVDREEVAAFLRTDKLYAAYALGDLDAVRTALDERENDVATVNEAFMIACVFASLTFFVTRRLDPVAQRTPARRAADQARLAASGSAE